MPWKYFSIEELKCKHCGKLNMSLVFVERLDTLRERVGFPLVISSGYRCPEHNNAVSNTGLNGPHTKSAVDIAVDRAKARIVLREALLMEFSGIGIQQKGTGRFIHLDDLPNAPGQPRPTVWSY